MVSIVPGIPEVEQERGPIPVDSSVLFTFTWYLNVCLKHNILPETG